MRKLLFICVSLFFSCCLFAKIQVAMLEPVAVAGDVRPIEKSMIRGEMTKAIASQEGYSAFSRTDIDQIMKEQNFQSSGMVDDNTRKRIGALQGVDFVCITKITKEGNAYYLEANLVDIETGQISSPATQYGELQNGGFGNMREVCENLALELVGGRGNTNTSTTSYLVEEKSSQNVSDKNKEVSPVEEKVVVSVENTPFVSYAGLPDNIENSKSYIYIRRPFQYMGSGVKHFIDVFDVNIGQIYSAGCILLVVNPGFIDLKDYVGNKRYDKLKEKRKFLNLSLKAEAGQSYYIQIVESLNSFEIETLEKADKYKVQSTYDFTYNTSK